MRLEKRKSIVNSFWNDKGFIIISFLGIKKYEDIFVSIFENLD